MRANLLSGDGVYSNHFDDVGVQLIEVGVSLTVESSTVVMMDGISVDCEFDGLVWRFSWGVCVAQYVADGGMSLIV